MADKYDHDCPFEAFITNLGKYNEGELVGEWVKFPTTPEQLQEVFQRIGIGQKDDFGQPYEEWFITDYDCYVDGLYNKLGEYANLDELNYLASKIEDMDRWDFERFQAAMEVGDHSGSVQEIINLTENLDCYDVYPDIHDHDDLGQYYINELDAMQVPEHLIDYIDYEAYGRDVAINEGGEFTSFGYVRDTGDRFVEFYDGERGSIPEEYRVMTFQDDIPEEELSEWAIDIAYDLDEFFRQHDPQYAAEHPEEHAAKEEIYENLTAGRISALDEKLAELGQTQEDYLPSELEKYKEASGYEEFLDVDPAAIREALQNPERSHVEEMLAFADQAEREYASQAEAFVQTPADIVEQAQAVQGELSPDALETGETVRTPRGSFYVTAMSREQMEAAGYGFHHQSEDGKYLIMGNGTQAFAISAEPVQEKDNPLRTAEMTLEDDYGMIDGVINNGRRGEEVEKAKPSIRERLEDAKRECSERKPPEKGRPSREAPEHGER
jgi:antirestriction protein